jgi:hypothetical protein
LDQRDGLSQCERGSLPLGVERGFPPRVQYIDPLLGLAHRAGVLAVHIEAISTAIDLGSTNLDQFEQLMF